MIRAILCRVLGKRVVSTLPFRAAPIVVAQSSRRLMLNHDKHLSQVTNIDDSSVTQCRFVLDVSKRCPLSHWGEGKPVEDWKRPAAQQAAPSPLFQLHSESTPFPPR